MPTFARTGNVPNMAHPLNKGRVGWWLCVSELMGGLVWHDLMRTLDLSLQSVGSTTGWHGPTRTGAQGRVLFDGSTEYALTSSFPTVTLPFTLACWINTASGSNQGPITIASNGGNNAGLGITSLKPYIYSTSQVTNTSSALSGWLRLVGVFISSTSRILYVNGQQAASGSGSNALAGMSILTLGAFATAGTPSGAYLNGSGDDFSVWNRPLSSAEALLDYQESMLGYPCTLAQPSTRFWSPGSTAYLQTCNETLSLTDALVRGCGIALVEVCGLTDTIARAAAKYLAEALSLADVRSLATGKLMADALFVTDARLQQFGKWLAESASIAGSAAALLDPPLLSLVVTTYATAADSMISESSEDECAADAMPDGTVDGGGVA